MKRMIISLLFALQGCASLAKAPNLRQNADELFKELENDGSNKTVNNSQEIRPQADMAAPNSSRAFKFEEEGVWRMSKAETQLYAERQAENDALAKALRSSGAEVYYGFSDVLAQQGGQGTEAVARYLQLWSKGAVKWARTGKTEFIPVSDGIFVCRVRVKGEVVFNGEQDPNFEIKLQSGGKELGLSRTILKDGESVEFSALLTKTAYLQILSVDQDQNVYLVYPNAFSKFSKVPAGQVFSFPTVASGLGLRATLQPGIDQASEVIHVIATKTSPLFEESDFAEANVGVYAALSAGKITELMGKLAGLKRSDWTMVVLPYEIIR